MPSNHGVSKIRVHMLVRWNSTAQVIVAASTVAKTLRSMTYHFFGFRMGCLLPGWWCGLPTKWLYRRLYVEYLTAFVGLGFMVRALFPGV